MDTKTYFTSLTSELVALQNRVRNFIHDAHWQTDGEWKESVLRSFFRRCLPRNIEVGRGFVVGPRYTSDQIDILLYSTDKPVLFRDGDLVFVTYDAVIGIIEVKTSLNNSTFRECVHKLAENASRIIPQSRPTKILGLFAYENNGVTSKMALRALQEAANQSAKRVVDLCSVGQDFFIRWWQFNPENEKEQIDRWHSYYLRSMAPAYFIHNVVEFVNPETVELNDGIWFPLDGKESFKEMEIGLSGRESDKMKLSLR